MDGLKMILNRQEDILSLIAGVDEGLKEQLISGLSGSARTVFLASIFEKTKKPMLIVTHNLASGTKSI